MCVCVCARALLRTSFVCVTHAPDASKKGRVVPCVSDYEELKHSAQTLGVRPFELDLADWGMERVKEWNQVAG